MCFILAENCESKAGVADHLEQTTESWGLPRNGKSIVNSLWWNGRGSSIK
jgi:hypothetical protein